MSIDPKCKKCRRAGEKLFLKSDRCFTPKCAITRNPNSPGAHGGRKRGRAASEYGTQLSEKQKVKRAYNIREKQFRKYFDIASNKKGITGEEFLSMLEMRLDNAVFRSGLAKSRSMARQEVGHGHFALNGRRVDIPSIMVKSGDKISIRKESLAKPIFLDLKDILKKYEAPEWMALDKENLSVEIKRAPKKEDVDSLFNMSLITEFYSR